MQLSEAAQARRRGAPDLIEPTLMKELLQALEIAKNILVFTGAGMSTGSGIADFRGPQGVWKRRQPVYIDDFLNSHKARLEYWDYKREGYESFCQARPNAAHLALVKMEQEGRLLGLATQNVDGLHSIAGHADNKVVEVHGTNRKVNCLSCDHSEDPARPFEEFETSGQAPKCPQCSGWLKPATISFGQALRDDDLRRALDWAEECDFVMSLGSTLSVHPAASIPMTAARRGVPYLIINQGPTDQDGLATFRLDEDLVEIVPRIVKGG